VDGELHLMLCYKCADAVRGKILQDMFNTAMRRWPRWLKRWARGVHMKRRQRMSKGKTMTIATKQYFLSPLRGSVSNRPILALRERGVTGVGDAP
jgi:hypothetical protein